VPVWECGSSRAKARAIFPVPKIPQESDMVTVILSMVIDCWLLIVGYWLLVVGCW
jgi:hypothetical protein